MNFQTNELLREKLSGEYVLGTLKGGARRQFEKLLFKDAALRRTVVAWQDRLTPLALFAASTTPSPRVWKQIEHRLNLGNSLKLNWLNLRENINFWRALGMSSSVLATVLIAVLLTKQMEPSAPTTSYVATLSDNNSQAVALVSGDAKHGTLTVKMVSEQVIAADKSLELWAVPKQGHPRSLGLLGANGSITLKLPENAAPESIPLLAVTLEPRGGSPDPNGPTGPIVFKGSWIQI